jgi:hypothetical protein
MNELLLNFIIWANYNDNMILSLEDKVPLVKTTTTIIDSKDGSLYCGRNGRSCCSHNICSDHVEQGDTLHLVQTVVEVEKGVIKEGCDHVFRGSE